jgi:cytochrome c553
MKKSLITAIALASVPFAAVVTAYAADAASNWGNHCAKCHGEDGKGQTKMGKKLKLRDLSDAAIQAKFTDEEAFKAMKVGVNDDKGKQVMKPTEEISDAEMHALVAYVRALKK